MRCVVNVAVLFSLVAASSFAETPNVVLILADDMGYGDVHALNNNSTIPTPNLDGLARDGITFTDNFSILTPGAQLFPQPGNLRFDAFSILPELCFPAATFLQLLFGLSANQLGSRARRKDMKNGQFPGVRLQGGPAVTCYPAKPIVKRNGSKAERQHGANQCDQAKCDFAVRTLSHCRAP